MFKSIAILLLFSSCSIFGFYQSGLLKRRRQLLVQFRDLLQRLRTEIGYFKDPLPLLFQKIQNDTNKSTDILLRQCLLAMETGTETIENIWQSAVKSAYHDEPLESTDFDILCKCGDFIGQSDYQSQQGHFELLMEELSRQIHDAEEASKVKGGLYSKAGLSIGAVLAIALL